MSAPTVSASHSAKVSKDYIESVTKSRKFTGSAASARLLRYLAERAELEPGESIKEFRVATEALGRGKDFDSRTDSVVRVTTARLRTKLEKYYADEGRDDPIRLHIPKGAYRLVALPAPLPEPPPQPPVPTPPAAKRYWAALGVALIAGGVALLVGYRLGSASTPPSAFAPHPEISRFWNAFHADRERGLRIVFSNERLAATDADARDDEVTPYSAPPVDEDGWHSGFGEVEGMYHLTQAAARVGLPLRPRRALVVDWDEVLDANVVYLGGPDTNPHVSEIRRSANFVFAKDDQDDFIITNRAPAPGEPSAYTVEGPLTADYALIRLTRGFRDDRWNLLLAGITTIGTAAAAESVSTPDSLAAIREMLGQSPTDPVIPFECVVKVGVKNNIPFDLSLETCRPIAESPETSP